MNNNKQILIEVKDKLKSLIREVLLEENWDNWSLIIDRTGKIHSCGQDHGSWIMSNYNPKMDPMYRINVQGRVDGPKTLYVDEKANNGMLRKKLIAFAEDNGIKYIVWGNSVTNRGRTEEINESINNTAGVEVDDEKFKDGSDFRIKFKVSDVIDLAKNKSIKEIDPKDINYDFSGRDEDSTKTKDRVTQADLSYPIIVVKNEKGKIFTILDGTHRLQKALNLNLDKIKTKILDKEELIQFKTNKL